MSTHCFICPTYGHYEYARAALASFFQHTTDGIALVIDDGHPKFRKFWDARWNVVAHHFPDRQGLTRSWNFGLIQARELCAQYTICGNSDILFTPGWSTGPTGLLDDDSVGVIGPLSNAPGLTNTLQNIWDHVPHYQSRDEAVHLAAIAAALALRYSTKAHLAVSAVNGFFMISRTTRWWDGCFDDHHVFNPAHRFALIHSEHELQKRLLARGWHSLVSLSTFIFHYRSVTRGEKFKQGLWHRRSK
jgi:GT2 family glycosyltransferase